MSYQANEVKWVAPILRVAALLVMTAFANGAAAPLAAPGGPAWPCHIIDDTGRGSDGTKLGDVNGDGRPDVVTGWEEGGSSRLYLHPGIAAVKQPWPKVIVGVTPSAEDAVFADVDGDGRLDVVSSCEGDTQRVFVQWAPNNVAKLLDPEAWQQGAFQAVAGLTRWMFAEPLQFDGRHGVDLIIGGKVARGAKRSVLGWLEAPSTLRDMAAWKWHPLTEMAWTMSIVLEDMDGDGDRDILYSDRHGPTAGIYWLENPGIIRVAAGATLQKHLVGAADAAEIMLLDTGDIDGDGLRDVAAVINVARTDRDAPAEHGRVAWYQRADRSGQKWRETRLRVPTGTGSIKAVAIGDIDGDSRADFVVSCENAKDELIGVYWLLHQEGKTHATEWPARNIAGAPGIKFDLVRLIDVDEDGDLDVLTNEEREGGKGLGVVWYENQR